VLINNLRSALAGIAGNRMRSALTMLGILIGTASVILLLAIGAGAQSRVQADLDAMGSDTITASPAAQTPSGAGGAMSASATGAEAPSSAGNADTSGAARAVLTERDVVALRQLSAVGTVVPTVNANVPAAMGTLAPIDASVVGTTHDYGRVQPISFTAGVMFSKEDVDQRRRVAVIGSTVARRLFPGGGAVGGEIRLGGVTYQVAGVLEARGSQSKFEGDTRVLVPLTAAAQTLVSPTAGYSNLLIKPRSLELSQLAVRQARATLTATHADQVSRGTGKADFELFDAKKFGDSAKSIGQSMTVLLGAMASISLLVGGIGVMNIMLVTVTERTREIGLRKAVGAPGRSIVSQFLIESVVLSVCGGLLGVIVGVTAAGFRFGNFEPTVRLPTVLLALGISAVTGVVFGSYPAAKASRLRPIDALRHE
jgi:putative ABC transport system permease protein